MEQILLTPEQAAHALSVSRTRVYDLIRTHQLQSVVVGGSRRIPRQALDEFVATLSTESDSR